MSITNDSSRSMILCDRDCLPYACIIPVCDVSVGVVRWVGGWLVRVELVQYLTEV